MTTLTRIRTDFDARLHVEIDTDAQVLDCFMVALPPYTSEPMLIHREGASMDELWADALALVAYLRAKPWRELHPPHIFQPFGIIAARNVEDVRRESELRMKMLLGQHSPDHMERVQNLCKAWDLLNGAPLPTLATWAQFTALKGLH
jgi:hypothetical protein